jgi:hypothetical protein
MSGPLPHHPMCRRTWLVSKPPKSQWSKSDTWYPPAAAGVDPKRSLPATVAGTAARQERMPSMRPQRVRRVSSGAGRHFAGFKYWLNQSMANLSACSRASP